jgi:hypothetical protein
VTAPAWANAPYFTPAPADVIAAHVTGTTHTEPDALIGPAGSYFQESAVSNRLGVFSYALVPGAGAAQGEGGTRSTSWLPLIWR